MHLASERLALLLLGHLPVEVVHSGLAHADWIIDLGSGAGHDGGRVVFEGTPADLVADATTHTGEHLKAYVGA